MKSLIKIVMIVGSLLLATFAFAQTEVPQLKITVPLHLGTGGAYSAGQFAGTTGALVVPGVVCPRYSTGYVTSIELSDKTGQQPLMDFTIFDSAPATTFTDHAVPVLSNTDLFLRKLVEKIDGVTSHSVSFSANGYQYVGSLADPITPAAAQTVYIVPVFQTAFTPVSATDLQLMFIVACDLQKLN